jgi:hypothetical protein
VGWPIFVCFSHMKERLPHPSRVSTDGNFLLIAFSLACLGTRSVGRIFFESMSQSYFHFRILRLKPAKRVATGFLFESATLGGQLDEKL